MKDAYQPNETPNLSWRLPNEVCSDGPSQDLSSFEARASPTKILSDEDIASELKKLVSKYRVYESFEDKAAQEEQPASASLLAYSRDLAPK